MLRSGASALSATALPNELEGFRSGIGTAQTSTPSLCSASNGVPPYTYLWTYVSGDTSIYTNTATSASAYFSRFFPDVAEFSAVWKCVVTDAAATVVDSNTVSITLVRYS